MRFPKNFDGSQWALHSIYGNDLIEGSHISLYFRNGSYWGFSGCNIYGGDYSLEAPNSFIPSGGSSTAMGCSSPEGVMEQEADYKTALLKATRYRLTGEQMELGNDSNQSQLIFDRKPEYSMNSADLVGTSWSLVSMNGDYITEGLSITLIFDSSSLAHGSAGCFDYELYYEANGDDIRWGMDDKRVGELPRELEKEALQYTDSLMWAANYRLDTERLEIFTARGDTLIFKPSSS